MKRKSIIIIVTVLVILCLFGCSTNQSVKSQDETAKSPLNEMKSDNQKGIEFYEEMGQFYEYCKKYENNTNYTIIESAIKDNGLVFWNESDYNHSDKVSKQYYEYFLRAQWENMSFDTNIKNAKVVRCLSFDGENNNECECALKIVSKDNIEYTVYIANPGEYYGIVQVFKNDTSIYKERLLIDCVMP